MQLLLYISISLFAVATVWSAYLVFRFRDMRLILVVLATGLMLTGRSLRLAWSGGSPEIATAPGEIWISLVVACISAVALGSVITLHRALLRRDHADRELRLLGASLSGSATPTMITGVSGQGSGPIIEFVNDAMLELTGRTREEMVGRPMGAIFMEEESSEASQRLEEALRERRPLLTTCPLTRKSGEQRWVNCSMSPVTAGEGKPKHLLWIKHDITDSRAAEEAVRETEALSRAVLDSLNAQICVTDRAGRIVAVNRSWSDVASQASEASRRAPAGHGCGVGSNYFDVCRRAIAEGNEDARRCLEGLLSVLEGGLSIFDYEYPCHTPSAKRWCLLRAVPLRGASSGLVISHIDITAQRRLEEDVRAKEEMYRLIVETATEGVWLVDGQWRTTYCNQRLSEMLKTTPDELFGKPVLDFVFEEDRAGVLALMRRREQGHSEQHDFRFRAADGSEVWTLISTNPLTDSAGRFKGALAMVLDIGPRRTAETNLRGALQKLSSHMDNSPLAVVEWDRDFRVAAWSSGAERIFGWRAEEVLGKHPSEWPIVFHDDAAHVASIIERLHAGIETRNLCLNRNTTKDGSVIWCQWWNSVVFDPDGSVNSVLSLAQNVTDRHLADERQRLLMLELDHRVKNNLTTVLGLAQQTLAASKSLMEFEGAFIGRVEALARAHGLLAKASWDGVDLRALCERILESALIGPVAQVSIVGPSISLSASQGSILALVFHELMTNAIKYGALSTPAGRVDLSWTLDDSGGVPILMLKWREQGGPLVHPPARAGFGSSFLRMGIAYELGGQSSCEYDPQGMRCSITLPLKDRGKDAASRRAANPVESEAR